MKHFLAVAGNIGAGKTTLAEKLAQNLNFELFQEPFLLNPYLENFYQDMLAWSFQCELSFLGHRLQNHLAISERPHSIVQDRCLYEGAEVFVKNLYVNNLLSEKDWETYNHLYENLKRALPAPDLIVYIESAPQRCFSNVQSRNRDMEQNLNLSYLESLHELYNDWRGNFSLCPIITADANNFDFKYNESDFQTLISKIKEELKIAS